MVNGLYTSALGMIQIQKKQDINSNNLANANTTGFKMSQLVTLAQINVRRDEEMKLHFESKQFADEVSTSFSQGPLVQTGNKLDVAMAGEGFLMIETQDGTRYTRNGSFSLNTEREIVTMSGYRVLDPGGAPLILDAHEPSIQTDGGVFSASKKIGQLGVVSFPSNAVLISQGDGLFKNIDPEGNPPSPAAAEVKQGFLEGSNVDTLSEMVHVITQYRNYEANQKTIHAIDETLGKAVNEVGRVG